MKKAISVFDIAFLTFFACSTLWARIANPRYPTETFIVNPSGRGYPIETFIVNPSGRVQLASNGLRLCVVADFTTNVDTKHTLQR